MFLYDYQNKLLYPTKTQVIWSFFLSVNYLQELLVNHYTVKVITLFYLN
jgi:hypothetical protein